MKNWDIRQLVFIITIVLAFRLSFETPAQAAPLVQDTTHCVALNEAGASLYFRAQYAEAIQKFQEALACYRDAPAGGRAGEGTTLNNIGEVYRAQGRYAEALESYQQALAIHHKVGNRAEEGITLNNISLVYYHEGRYAEALAQLQQALVIRREVSDQAGEGDILNNIGVLYKAQGRYAKALENYQQALAVAREADDRAGAGGILNNIGKVYQAQGHYTEALEMYQQALAVAREVGDRAGEGTILNNIGWVYDNQGRYAEALKMYQQALVIRRDIDDRAGEGATLNSIGLVYEAQGHYAEALAQLQQALLIQQRMGAPAAEGTTLNNIGVVYTHQGCYVEALEAYQQALVICQEIGDRAGEGTALNNIGCIYWTQERYDEALALLQQTLVIRREIGDRAGEGNSLNNIGAVYRDQGRYIEALEMFQQALPILCEVGNRAMEGDTLNNIGAVYRDQGRYAEALEMYRQALMIRREIGDRAREGTTLNNTGVVYQAQERYAEALDAYRQAMDAFEAVRAVAGSEQGRAGFITQHAGLYTRAASLFHQQGQDEEAFFTSERGRARAFLDSLATGHVELTDGEAAALLAQEQEAYTARQAAQDALIRVRALDPSTGSGQTPPDPSLVADLEAQLAEAEAAHVEALTAVEARGDQLAALVPGRSTVLGLSDVQALLNEETTLLSYFVLEDQTLAFLITRTGFEVVAIEVSRQELADRVSYFRDVIPFRQPEAAQPAAQELYQLLIAPLSSSLRTSRLMIVPHGPLHYLPFAALVDPATGQTLLDRYTLITLPSASALPFIQQNRTPPRRFSTFRRICPHPGQPSHQRPRPVPAHLRRAGGSNRRQSLPNPTAAG